MGVQYIHKDVQLMQNQITSIDYVQGTDVIPIKITVLDYIIPTGCEIRVYIHKPSGAIIYNMASISGQTVTINPTTQMFAESGQSKGNVEFIHNGKKIATFPIMFNIYPNYRDEGALESKDEYEALIHYMLLSQSYAIGGSGIRSGENTDNSKYYMTQSKSWTQGGTNARTGEATNNAKYWSTLGRSYAVGDTNSRTGETTDNAKYYMTQAKSWTQGGTNARTGEATNNAKYWAGESKTSATNSANSATASANSAAASANSAAASKTSANESSKWKTESKSWAVGGTNVRKNENTDNAKYYANYAKEQAELAKERALSSIKPKGTIAFANIPTTGITTGDMYNISNAFTTDARFKEGAGHLYPAGSNIYWTTDSKWDVFAGIQVTGVKGNAETNYRNGNVNITKANIGLGNADNTKDADKHVAYAESAGDGVKSVTASGMNMVLEKNNGTKITFTAEAGDVGQLSRNTHTNLINPELYTTIKTTYKSHGLTYTNNGDGTFTVDGTSDDTVGGDGFQATNLVQWNGSLMIDCEGASKVRLTGCPSGYDGKIKLQYADVNNGTTAWWADTGSGANISTSDGKLTTYCFRIEVAPNTTLDNVVFKPMLTLDMSANYSDYVEYSGPGESLSQHVAEIYQGHKGVITNLLNPIIKTETITNGVTCTPLADGTYRVKGTATANTWFQLRPDETWAAGRYRIVGCPKGGGTNANAGAYQFYIRTGPNSDTSHLYFADTGYGSTFSTSKDDIWRINIMVFSGKTVDAIFKPMITKDLTANYSDFVPYSGDGNLNQNVAALFDVFHPVGTIYETLNGSFNPNNTPGWHGTWERIKGRFLYGCEDGQEIGSTGGSNTCTLSVASLPSHHHDLGSHVHTLGNHSHTVNDHNHYIPALSGSTGNPSADHIHGTIMQRSNAGAGRGDWGLTASGAFGGNVLLAPGAGGGAYSLPTQGVNAWHTHSVTTDASYTWGSSPGTSACNTNTGAASGDTGNTGSGSAFNIMPSHIRVYIWKRVS